MPNYWGDTGPDVSSYYRDAGKADANPPGGGVAGPSTSQPDAVTNDIPPDAKDYLDSLAYSLAKKGEWKKGPAVPWFPQGKTRAELQAWLKVHQNDPLVVANWDRIKPLYEMLGPVDPRTSAIDKRNVERSREGAMNPFGRTVYRAGTEPKVDAPEGFDQLSGQLFYNKATQQIWTKEDGTINLADVGQQPGQGISFYPNSGNSLFGMNVQGAIAQQNQTVPQQPPPYPQPYMPQPNPYYAQVPYYGQPYMQTQPYLNQPYPYGPPPQQPPVQQPPVTTPVQPPTGQPNTYPGGNPNFNEALPPTDGRPPAPAIDKTLYGGVPNRQNIAPVNGATIDVNPALDPNGNPPPPTTPTKPVVQNKPLTPQQLALVAKVQGFMTDGKISQQEFESVRGDLHALFGGIEGRIAANRVGKHIVNPIARTVPAYNYRQEKAVAALKDDRARNGIVEGLPPDPNVFPAKGDSTMGGFTNPLRAFGSTSAVTDPTKIK